MEKRKKPPPAARITSKIHTMLCCVHLPKVSSAMVMAGNCEPIWSYNSANCGTTTVNMKISSPVTRVSSTHG